jgi:putative transposase
MSSTHLCLHYHLIFSTKDRVAYMHKAWRERLFAFLGDIVKDLGGVPEVVGGVEDHVHLLIGLRATQSLADAVREIKAASSRWVHQEMRKQEFSWQEGYGAFTVSASQLEVVKQYIRNQEEHHRKKSSLAEYVEFLKAHGVKYNEQYL